MSVENMGNGYVKVGVKQEDLEAKYSGIKAVKNRILRRKSHAETETIRGRQLSTEQRSENILIQL